MGNHMVGKMFHIGLLHLEEKDIDNLSQKQAMNLINKLGNEISLLTSLDAEFDDYSNPDKSLGRVLIKAFIPEKYIEWKNKKYVDDDMDEIYHYKLWKPFTDLFGFY